jgi:hypothetical protein
MSQKPSEQRPDEQSESVSQVGAFSQVPDEQ